MEKIIIYVAGNPNAYPMEYYDSETGSYEGVMPELLRRFSEESVYDVQYYAAGAADHREQLSSNLQVDLVSGCDGTERFAGTVGRGLTVLEAKQDGEPVSYRIYFTEAAPETLMEDLESFAAEMGEEASTGLLLDISMQQRARIQPGLKAALAGLSLAAAVLAAAVVILARKYKKRIKALEQDQETDRATGAGNMAHLARYFRTMVYDKNRVLYWMFYFYFDIERMEKSGSHGDLTEFARYVAVVLQGYTKDTDILARVSDNGFAILRLSANEREAKEWFLPALEKIRGFSGSRGKGMSYEAAVGIYPLKADDRDLDTILFYASQGALAACRKGMDFETCTDEVIRGIREKQRLQADMEVGFRNEEFQLYVQFYVDAKDGRIVGGEALSRWDHPEKGLLSPDRYVPLMEKAGTISRLDYDSLEKSCAFLEELGQDGNENFFLSCNFSRETFSEGDFAARCRAIVEKYRFERNRLIFEITESAAIRSHEAAKKNIRSIQEMGIRISLDDFGEGFTSFFDIQEYSLDALKLDKSLTDNLGTTAGDVILRSMITAGHELGLIVLAEGVEKEEQARILREMNCDIIQGFRFYQPIPAWEARRLLAGQSTGKERSFV